MAVAETGVVNEQHEPTEREEAILEVLKSGRDEGEPWGRATPGWLAGRLGESGQSVNHSLRGLRAAGWVRKIDRGLYEFVADPREDGPRDE